MKNLRKISTTVIASFTLFLVAEISAAADDPYLMTQVKKMAKGQQFNSNLLTDCDPRGVRFRELALREGALDKAIYDTTVNLCSPEKQAEINRQAAEFAVSPEEALKKSQAQ